MTDPGFQIQEELPLPFHFCNFQIAIGTQTKKSNDKKRGTVDKRNSKFTNSYYESN